MAHMITIDEHLKTLSASGVIELAQTCISNLQEIISQGFAECCEGIDPGAGAKPEDLVRETLVSIFNDRFKLACSGDDQDAADAMTKSLQEQLRQIGNADSIRTYTAFSNTLEKAIHGGITVKEPLFIKASGQADTLVVVFAGMCCFPEFKNSLGKIETVDQLHILDPNRSWYMQDPDGDWKGYEFYNALVTRKIEQLKASTPYKKVCFMGNSAGASAACLFSAHADALLAFCPQTSIPADEVPDEIMEKYESLFLANLKATIASGKPVYLHRGVADFDEEQFAPLADVDAIVHKECDDHNVPGYLKGQGVLETILNEFIAG